MVNSLYDLRRDRLKEVMVERYDGKHSDLAEVLDISPSYVSRIFSERNRKKIGETLARDFEQKLNKPNCWLDGISCNTNTDVSWPFPSIDPGRIFSLTKKQQKGIENALEAAIRLLEPDEKIPDKRQA